MNMRTAVMISMSFLYNSFALIHNKLTSEMCLLGFRQVWGLCASLFLLFSIRLFFFMRWNHIDVLIFPIDTFLEQCIYGSRPKKVHVCIAFPFPFCVKKTQMKHFWKRMHQLHHSWYLQAFMQAILKLFEMINNAGYLDCCCNAFKEPGTETSGSSNIPAHFKQHLAE